MKFNQRIREVARLHDIRSVLGLNDGKRLIVCPLPQHKHANHTPSFSIIDRGIPQRFKCHGSCGLSGDVIDLVGYMKIAGYEKHNASHVERAASLLTRNFQVQVHIPTPEPTLDPEEWKRYVPMDTLGLEYAHRRGLSDASIQRFRLGQKQHGMTIPTFEHGSLRAIKVRSLYKGSRVRYWNLQGSRGSLFNHDEVYHTTEPVLIAKGEIAAMLLSQHGFKACAPNAGEGQKQLEQQWLAALAFAKKRVVIGDNDRDPKVAEKTLAQAKDRAAALRAELRFPPAAYKDIDEWILAEPQAIEEITAWMN